MTDQQDKRRLRVLVVEDNPHVAELIRHGLRGNASVDAEFVIDCVMARDGYEATEQLRASRFDALIADIYLPGMDGASLIAAVRAGDHPDLPIIAVSAGGDPARKAAMDAGANVFVDKPMRLHALVATLQKLV